MRSNARADTAGSQAFSIDAFTSAGVTVLASAHDLARPADPLGATGVVRWHGSVALDDQLIRVIGDAAYELGTERVDAALVRG